MSTISNALENGIAEPKEIRGSQEAVLKAAERVFDSKDFQESTVSDVAREDGG